MLPSVPCLSYLWKPYFSLKSSSDITFFHEMCLQQEQLTWCIMCILDWNTTVIYFYYLFTNLLLLLNYESLGAMTMFNSFRAPMYNTVCLKIQAQGKNLLNEQIFIFKTQFPPPIEVTFYSYFTLCAVSSRFFFNHISEDSGSLPCFYISNLPYVITPIMESFSLVSLPFLSLKSYTG